jgi:hypothetical protein
MKVRKQILYVMLLAELLLSACCAQSLTPRAYLITPLHSNAVIVSWSYYNGDIDFTGALPVSEATGAYNISILSLYHAFGIFGRSANVVASLPYAVGTFQGIFATNEQNIYRSGLADSSYRFSVNLKGGPAMPVQQFVKWKQKVLIGTSLRVIAPTGQYDPTKLINWGANRWAFKPELGYSQSFGHWVVDGYAGVWFFTTNNDFWSRNSYYAGTRSQSQSPIGAFEGHVIYDFTKRGLWASLDGNFWLGGTTTIAGVENSLTRQANSRLGATVAIPFTRHQSVKMSYSAGTYNEYGGDYQNVSLAWQYSWLGKPQ